MLDPFSGTGTTGVTALKLGRRYGGIDLSEKYIDMAHKRLKSIADQEKMRTEEGWRESWQIFSLKT